MTEKNLSVAAIENGTVIDHIRKGGALKVLRLLKLDDHDKTVTLGLNLPSKTLGYKDLIKIEGRTLTAAEASEVAIFAPEASINIISNFKVVKKFKVELPQMIEKWMRCPNSRCITNHESIVTKFAVLKRGNNVELKCYYCEKVLTYAPA